MTNWQASKPRASTARALPKTKDELRRMLTEAVCNTRTGAADDEAKKPSKVKRAGAR
jgi:hypothetical protein